jgi:hypothetical protein
MLNLRWAAMTAVGAVLFLSAASLAGGAAARPAGGPQAPVAIVSEVYRRLTADQHTFPPQYEPPVSIYSPRLKTLVAGARRAANGEAACGLDFVFWVNGDNLELSDVSVVPGPAPAAPGHRTVIATFVNIHSHEKIIFDFKTIHGRWRLDDAQSVGEGSKWTFSRLLQCKDG